MTRRRLLRVTFAGVYRWLTLHYMPPRHRRRSGPPDIASTRMAQEAAARRSPFIARILFADALE